MNQKQSFNTSFDTFRGQEPDNEYQDLLQESMKREIFLRQMLGTTKLRDTLMMKQFKMATLELGFQKLKKKPHQHKKIFDCSVDDSRMRLLDKPNKLSQVNRCERCSSMTVMKDYQVKSIEDKENEVNQRLKQMKLTPLNYLLDAEQLKQAIKTMKHNYLEQNIAKDVVGIRSENDEFYAIFKNPTIDSKEEVGRKIEYLKNFELRLVEERFRTDVAYNYLQKELENIEDKQRELGDEILRYQSLCQQALEQRNQYSQSIIPKNAVSKYGRSENESVCYNNNNYSKISISQVSQQMGFSKPQDESIRLSPPKAKYSDDSYHNTDEDQLYLQKQQQLRLRYLMMKFSFILIHRHSHRYRNKPVALRGAYYNLWKLINMRESLHRVLNTNNSVEIMDPFLDRSWQVQKSQLIRDSRFPFSSLSKLRKTYEEARFDWERKKQWKQRFFTLFNAILRNNRRRVRQLKTIGYHVFTRNIALMQYKLRGGDQISTVIKEDSRRVQDSRREVDSRREIDRVPSQQKIKSNNKPKQLQSSEVLVDSKNTKQQFDTQQVNRIKAVHKILHFHQKQSKSDEYNVLLAFVKWNRYSGSFENRGMQDELNSINFLLNERVFRENYFRTKLQLTKSEIDSKVEMINQLVQMIVMRTK